MKRKAVKKVLATGLSVVCLLGSSLAVCAEEQQTQTTPSTNSYTTEGSYDIPISTGDEKGDSTMFTIALPVEIVLKPTLKADNTVAYQGDYSVYACGYLPNKVLMISPKQLNDADNSVDATAFTVTGANTHETGTLIPYQEMLGFYTNLSVFGEDTSFKTDTELSARLVKISSSLSDFTTTGNKATGSFYMTTATMDNYEGSVTFKVALDDGKVGQSTGSNYASKLAGAIKKAIPTTTTTGEGAGTTN